MSIFNAPIKAAIAARTPCAYGKLGYTEALQLSRRMGARPWQEGRWYDRSLSVNAGFYPLALHACERWAEIYTAALGAMDGLVEWAPGEMDRAPLERYAPQAVIGDEKTDILPIGLGPASWHYALAGKKVLVVHPFRQTIRLQVPKFGLVWPGASVGEVVIVKAPQSPLVCGKKPFATWFEALDWMKGQIKKHTFDLAVLGCGSYGLPLAKFIKEECKVPALHLGGKAQLLFGILGKRWDNFGVAWREANNYGGDHWIRPVQVDVPRGAHMMDYGCYW